MFRLGFVAAPCEEEIDAVPGSITCLNHESCSLSGARYYLWAAGTIVADLMLSSFGKFLSK